jgi:hypothetical protein
MAKRLSADVKPMKSPTSNHKKAKRPLTAMTVAFSSNLAARFSLADKPKKMLQVQGIEMPDEFIIP